MIQSDGPGLRRMVAARTNPGSAESWNGSVLQVSGLGRERIGFVCNFVPLLF